MTHIESLPQRRRAGIRFALPILVLAGLAAGFFVLERQRDERLLRDSIKLAESIDGDVVSARFVGPQITTRQLQHVRQYPGLHNLNFSGSTSLEGGLKTLEDFHELTTIDLSRVRWLDEQAMSDLAGLPKLGNLMLSESNITDPLLAQLAGHPALKHLSLRRCGYLTDQSIDTLLKLPALELVVLSETPISLAGFARLRTARRDMTIAYSPDSSTTGINVEVFSSTLSGAGKDAVTIRSSGSAADLELLMSLPHDWATGRTTSERLPLKNVLEIELSGPSAVESMAWLAPRVAGLQSLTLPAAALLELTPEQLERVTALRLEEVTSADPLRLITRMPALKSLHVAVTMPLDDDAVQPPDELPRLEFLNLVGPGVNDAVVRLLSRITSPESLTMELASPLTPDTLQDPGGWRGARRITLIGPGVDDALVRALDQMRDLRLLELRLVSPLSPDTLLALNRLSELDDITLEGAGVSDPLVAALSRFEGLDDLSVRRAPVSDAGFAPLLKTSAPPRIFTTQTHVSPQMQERLEQTHRR